MDVVSNKDNRAGIQLYLNQDYAGAEHALSDAVKMNPTWSEGWSYLGYAQYMQKRYTEAGASLERAVMMDQESPEARFGLGLVWAAMKRVDAAIACWDETLRLKPTHADAKRSLVGALIYRGQQNIAQKDYDRAEIDLERAIKLDRNAAQAVVILTNHFIEQNMVQRAQRTVKEGLAHMPNDGQIQELAVKLNVRADKDLLGDAHDAQAKQQVRKAQEVPCPNCKRPVMEWASICPHCNMQIKALPSLFTGRKASVPTTEWQEVAFYVFTSLWVLANLAPVILLLASGGVDKAFSGIGAFVSTFYLVMVGVGIGCLFKNETLMFIAKILCYIVLLFTSINLFVGFFTGFYAMAAIYALLLALTGFMIYLLNYMSD